MTARGRRGYAGRVRLASPDGTRETVVILPGRARIFPDQRIRSCDFPTRRDRNRRETRRFYRLLSAGWSVIASDTDERQKRDLSSEPARADPSVQKAPEGLEEVVEVTSLTSSEVHGGQRASKDIPNSPNAADDGASGESNSGPVPRDAAETAEHPAVQPQPPQPQPPAPRPRGQRARRKKDTPPEPSSSLAPRAGTGGSVYSRTPLQVTTGTQHAAAESARLLADLVGVRSEQTTVQGTCVDIHALLLALESGSNPLPALEQPRQRPRMRIVVSPDCSGSTQDWSGLAQAWALALAGSDDLDVVYVENCNGTFADECGSPLDADPLLAHVDLLIYLGDHDGEALCREYAATGSAVIALDSYGASRQSPRVRDRSHTSAGGALTWIDQTSAKAPGSWTGALRAALT